MSKEFDGIQLLIKKVKGIQIQDSDIEKRLISDLKFESIDVAELGDEIEKKFGLNLFKSIREKPAKNMNPMNYSIEELVQLLKK